MQDDESFVSMLYGQRIRGRSGGHACTDKQLLECNPLPLEYQLKGNVASELIAELSFQWPKYR